MESKTLIWAGMIAGSLLGGWLPCLWGQDVLSIWSLVGSTVGAMVGIYAGYKLADSGLLF